MGNGEGLQILLARATDVKEQIYTIGALEALGRLSITMPSCYSSTCRL